MALPFFVGCPVAPKALRLVGRLKLNDVLTDRFSQALIAGFFSMNFENLQGTGIGDGWIWVTLSMAIITVGSLLVFVAAGWIRPPAGRAGRRVGRGLIDAAKRPATLAGALFVRSHRSRRNP